MTSDWLAHDEFVPHAPEDPGTVNVHHCKEGHGNDRLYVTRNPDGTIMAFCFHCSRRGFYAASGYGKRWATENKTEPKSEVVDQLEKILRNASTTLSKDAIGYLYSRSCENSLNLRKHVFMDHHNNALGIKVLGLHHGNVRLKKLELKAVNDKCAFTGKTRTYNAVDSREMATLPVSNTEWNAVDVLVLTEDWCSAYSITDAMDEDSECPWEVMGLPLLGTHIDEPTKALITGGSFLPRLKKVLVWLDNDKHEVEHAARKILRDVEWKYQAKVVRDRNEPSDYYLEEIRGIIKEELDND